MKLRPFEFENVVVNQDFEKYYEIAQTYLTIMPDVIGMPAMDAIAILENMKINVKVKLNGSGTIKSQSINKNIKLKDNEIIVLVAS